MSVDHFVESSGMAMARNLFGSRTDQVLVKDEVTSKPSRDPYEAIRLASERMTAGRSIFATEEKNSPETEQEVRRHAGFLSAL